jgi:hypothetical protein
MSNTKVSMAPCHTINYIWNDKKTMLVDSGATTADAFEVTKKFYKEKIDRSIEDWQLLMLPMTISDSPQSVIDFFVEKVISNLKKRDIFIAIKGYDYNDSRDFQLLNDVLYCISENQKSTKIELVENINKELSAILVHELESTWKSEFTKKKEHKKIGKVLKSLNVSQISSFVADSEKITFKLKSSSLVSIGYGDLNNEYDLQVQSYSLN